MATSYPSIDLGLPSNKEMELPAGLPAAGAPRSPILYLFAMASSLLQRAPAAAMTPRGSSLLNR